MVRRAERNGNSRIGGVHGAGVLLELGNQGGYRVKIPRIHNQLCLSMAGDSVVLCTGIHGGKLIGRFDGLQQPEQQLCGIGVSGTDVISRMPAG